MNILNIIKLFVKVDDFVKIHEKKSKLLTNSKKSVTRTPELSSNDNEPLLAYNLAKTKYPLRAWITNVEVIENITYLCFIDDIKISINNLKKWSLSFTVGLEDHLIVKYDIICKNGIFEKTEEIRFISKE